MFDCANVEMRELLPELVAGSLDASSRARVEAHVRECAECASELETLRVVRASFAAAPTIDTARIVAALPKPAVVAAAPAARRAPRAARSIDWRIAATVTMITLGGLSVAVTQRVQTGRRVDAGIDTTTQSQIDSTVEMTRVATPSTRQGTSGTGTSLPGESTTPAAARAPTAQLTFGAASDADLDDEAFHALLSALDDIDRGPLAPSAEPDPSPVLPVIREGSR